MLSTLKKMNNLSVQVNYIQNGMQRYGHRLDTLETNSGIEYRGELNSHQYRGHSAASRDKSKKKTKKNRVDEEGQRQLGVVQ